MRVRCCAVNVRRVRTVLPLGLLMLLCGCGSMISSLPVVGEPATAPAHPAEAPATPSLYARPDPQTDKALSAEERAKLEAELVAARTNAATLKRQEIQGTPLAPPAAATPAPAVATATTGSIGGR